MEVIGIRDLSFSYGSNKVLKGVSMSIRENQLMCIFGANGSGKSTLLDCITAINDVDKGAITILGRPIDEYKPRELARHIAYVPQKSGIGFPYTVMEVMLMSRASRIAIHSVPRVRDAEICENALKDIGVLHLRDKMFTELSGGEAQLVLIARALAQETRIIVMDEPTAHLDYSYKYIVLDQIVRLVRDRGLTILMASHMPNHSYYLENQGLDVMVSVIRDGGIFIMDKPSKALTKETMLELYGVDVRSISFSDDSGRGQYIVPLGKRGQAG